MGLDLSTRNGYSGIRVAFTLRGDASSDVLVGLVGRYRQRSAAYDVLTNGTGIDVEVNTA